MSAGRHKPHFSPFFMFGGLALGVFKGVLHQFHGVLGAEESRRHGEMAVALRAISFWTSDTPWQVGGWLGGWMGGVLMLCFIVLYI